MLTIVSIDTPTLGDRSYLAHDGRVAVVVDPQRDIDRVLDLADAAGVRITHVFETHIHNDYITGGYALAPRPAPPITSTPTTRSPSTGCRCVTVTSSPSETGCGSPRWRPRGTPSPTCPTRSTTSTAPSGCRSGCSPAGRCCTARSAARICSARPTPTPWPATSTPPPTGWPPTGRHPGAADPRVRQLLRRDPKHRRRLDDRRGEDRQSGADPRPRRVHRRTARRPGRMAGLLRAHGRRQQRRPTPSACRPARTGRRRRDPGPARRRGMGRRPAPPRRVRRRARRRHPQHRPGRQLRHLSRLAHPTAPR